MNHVFFFACLRREVTFYITYIPIELLMTYAIQGGHDRWRHQLKHAKDFGWRTIGQRTFWCPGTKEKSDKATRIDAVVEI